MTEARLYEVYDFFKDIFKAPPLKISEIPITTEDKMRIKKYAEEPSNFDGDSYRQDMWSSGVLRRIQIGPHTLYMIGTAPEGGSEADERRFLALFGRVLQGMGHLKAYTIYFFRNPSKREFPSRGEEVGPKNVNGGYCQACQPNTIVIYREEDALRVLIHELQHAACCDDHSRSIPAVEAETEAWAELMYAMVLAVDLGLKPEAAWRIQSSWSVGQNKRLREEFNVTLPRDYAWRYTVGKELVWRRWGLPLASPSATKGSMKLGAPERRFYNASLMKE